MSDFLGSSGADAEHGPKHAGLRVIAQTAEERVVVLSQDQWRHLCGAGGRYLSRLEQDLDVQINDVGNQLIILGHPIAIEQAENAIGSALTRIDSGLDLDDGALRDIIRTVRRGLTPTAERAALSAISGGDRAPMARALKVTPRTANQKLYVDALNTNELVFGVGPAGTGKTFLAVAQAVMALSTQQVRRIVITRPAVEAGERLGFLPGDLKEKVDPYLRPIYDALNLLMPSGRLEKAMADNTVEVAPLAFMRGRTLSDAFIILDEAQNTTVAQMKMVLTRLGSSSRMVITGDPTQVDLPPATRSGLADALQVLRGVPGIAVVTFDAEDVVRHPLVGRIIDAYAAQQRRSARDAGSTRPPAPKRAPASTDAPSEGATSNRAEPDGGSAPNP